MMKKTVLLAFAFIWFTTQTNAQNKFEAHVGVSIPSGSFADNAVENSIFNGSGCATTGLTIGAKYFYTVSNTKGLSLTLGVDILQNGISQDFKDNLQQSMNETLSSLYGSTMGEIYKAHSSIKYMNYINVPVIAGLNYKLDVDKKVALFGDAGLGFNFSNITNLVMEVSYAGQSQTAKVKFDPQTKFAIQLGGGILIQDKYSIGLHYNQLGCYKFRGKNIDSNGKSTNIYAQKELDLNILNLALGIRF
jgi:opacity protein-like surface antigen